MQWGGGVARKGAATAVFRSDTGLTGLCSLESAECIKPEKKKGTDEGTRVICSKVASIEALVKNRREEHTQARYENN